MNENLGNLKTLHYNSETHSIYSELKKVHGEFLRAYCLKKDQRIDPDQFCSDVLNAVHFRYLDTESFRAEVLDKGVQELRNIKYFRGIVRNIFREHQRKYYNAMPRETTGSETVWLRLLLCRDDGMVFPLVRRAMGPDERRWLEKLANKKMSKVHRVPIAPHTNVWAYDEAKRPITLMVTGRGEGDGERDLEKLCARRFLERVPCDDVEKVWKKIDGIPYALQLSSLGRSYIQQLGTASSFISIHSSNSASENSLASGVDRSQEDLDAYYETRWYVGLGLSLRDVLEVAVNRLGMPETHARIYLLHKLGDPPEKGPWPRNRIGNEVGLHPRKVERIEKRWDDTFQSKEFAELMKAYLGLE